MKTTVFRVGSALLLGVFLLPVAKLFAASVEVPVHAPSRLQELEHKASEYERYRARYFKLQKTLDEMLALLPGTDGKQDSLSPSSGLGQLSALLEKAALGDRLVREIEQVQTECEHLRRQSDALKKEVQALEAERDKAVEEAAESAAVAEQWKAKTAGLRETVERLLLGEFEYYEVKKDDTLQSIAADPLVYGDPARAVWLRQANDGRVKHLDNLRTGEVLVVPRFPRNGSYEF